MRDSGGSAGCCGWEALNEISGGTKDAYLCN